MPPTNVPHAVRVEQTFDLSAHACADASLVAYLNQLGNALEPPLPGARLWSDLICAYDHRRGRARVPLPHPIRVRLCSLPTDTSFGPDDGALWLRAVDAAHRQDSNETLRCRAGAPLELRVSEPQFWKPGPDLCAQRLFHERTPGIACAVTIGLTAFILVATTATTNHTTAKKRATRRMVDTLTNLLLTDF